MKPYEKEFHKIVPVGFTYRYNGYKYHLAGFFFDEGTDFYIVKYYGKYRQWWHYEIITRYEFYYQALDELEKQGYLK